MSAIFGIFNFDKQPIARDDLERMGTALKPYGPEDGGTWSHGPLGLGQCLMRFTPEDKYERQPLVSTDGKSALVFSGRIDNRLDLVNKLGIPAVEAYSLPDSAFILMAYQAWGNDCLQHLIGYFTYALWDDVLQQLLIVRSAAGGPPLFFHTTPRTLAFASMRKGLFILPHVPRKLDEQVLADYLARIPIHPDLGFYQEIKRLPGGHSLCLSPDGFKTERFWQPKLTESIHYPKDNDYIEAFNELFTRVVSDHLRSQTAVGIMMSGGLDSSSVAAVAAPLLKERGESLTAFTEVPRIGFKEPIIEGRYADETPYVQAIAAMYDNMQLNLVRTDGQVYLDGLDVFFNASEVPFRNASNRVYFEAILKAARDKGINTLLTGGQGNLTISWPGSDLLPQLVRQGRLGRAFLEARAISRNGTSQSGIRTLISQGVMPLLPTPIWFTIQTLRHRDVPARKTLKAKTPWQDNSAIHPDFARKHRIYDRVLENGHDFLNHQDTRSRSARLRVLENAGMMLDGLVTGHEQMYGVETRDPTSDQRMVEFCLGLPEEQFSGAGIPKRLIRTTMEGRLPDEVLWNKKRGLQTADWFERLIKAKPKILETLHQMEKNEIACQVIDIPRLHRLVDAMTLTGAEPETLIRDYRQILEFGLMTGCFIVWFETGRFK